MYWGLTWGLKGPTLGRKGYKSESGIRQHHLLPPDISCPVYCVLTVVMKVSMVRNKTRKLLVTKTASVLPSVLHSQLSRHKNCNKTIVTNQLYCAVSALHKGNWLSHDSQFTMIMKRSPLCTFTLFILSVISSFVSPRCHGQNAEVL